MIPGLTPERLASSAEGYAQTALIARHSAQFHRMAVDAATCLEHLAKACLAARSPALLAELRGGGQEFESLLMLVGVDGPKPRQLRTVSLRAALERVRKLVVSPVPEKDVMTLVDLRDGVIHAALDEEVEDRLLAAFVRQADALLGDLGRDRAEFWEPQLAVVDALLAEVSDRTLRKVLVSIAAARANYARRWGDLGAGVVELARRQAVYNIDFDEERLDCPACGSPAVAVGGHDVQWRHGRRPAASREEADGTVWFYPSYLSCRMCELELADILELEAADVDWPWAVVGADPAEYDPGPDDDGGYDRWREEHRSD